MNGFFDKNSTSLRLAEQALFDARESLWLIQKLFVEPGFRDEPPGVGLEVSDADTMLAYLSTANA